MTDHNSYSAACTLVENVIDQHKLDEKQARALRDAHELSFRSDVGNGISYQTMSGAPIIDPSTLSPVVDTAGFLRAMRRDRPEMLVATPAPKAAPVATPKTPTLTEAFAAAARGDDSLFALIGKNSSLPTSSTAKKFNLTEAMVKAKSGDKAAIDAINDFMKA